MLAEQLVQAKQELATALNKIYDLEKNGKKGDTAADKKLSYKDDGVREKEAMSEGGEEMKQQASLQTL